MSEQTAYDLAVAEILKEHGNVVLDARSILEEEQVVIPTTPRLDIALNGGIPQGSWVLIPGPEKVGKTTMALKIAANCQKMGMWTWYADVEGRLKKMNLGGIHGLKTAPPDFTVLRSTDDKILSAQDFLQATTKILWGTKRMCVIIDSASALCDRLELDGGVGTELSGRGGPKLLASFCRINANAVQVNKHVVVVMAHLMANIGRSMPGTKKTVEKSGYAIRYQHDVKLVAKYEQPWKDKNDRQIGQSVHWEVETSALGPPGAKVEGFLRYGYGFDDLHEAILVGQDLGLISRAGKAGFITFDFLAGETPDPVKARTAEDARELLVDNPAWAEKLLGQISSMVRPA